MKNNLMLVAALMVSVVAFGQGGSNHRGKTGNKTEKMKAVLELTESQYQAVKNVNEKYSEKISSLRKDTTMQREQIHKEIRSIRDAKEKELGTVLTPEQREKWTTYKKEARENRKANKGKREGSRKDEMKKALSLSDEQSAKMDVAHQTFRKEIKAMQADTSLTDESRKAKFQSARADHTAAIKGILNADQYGKWTEMADDRKKKMGKLKKGSHFRQK